MNRVTLQFTKFTNFDSKELLKSSTYGYRIYDDVGKDYNNTFNTIEELLETITEENIFDYILENHPEYYETVTSHSQGVYLNEEWIDFLDTEEETNPLPLMKFRKFQTRAFHDGTFSVIFHHDDPNGGETIVFESVENINLSYEAAKENALHFEKLFEKGLLIVDVTDDNKWTQLDTI